jgi:hypothetical protein
MRSGPSHTFLLLGIFLLAGGWPVRQASAAPYRPASDSDVLEHLPSRPMGPGPARERALREFIARQPDQLDLALRLAAIEVERTRVTSDPRPLGQAEALLSPWWSQQQPPVPVLLLRATIRQRSHAFALARADLLQAVDREPDNAQAWLMLASIEQVSGNFPATADACAHLNGIAARAVHVACVAALEGVSGQAAKAYSRVAGALADTSSRTETELRDWMLTLQAELAERLGHAEDAERLYRLSLAANPHDTYTIAAYADFLLDAARPQDVVPLIAADTSVDALLLRRAQAAQRSGRPDASAIIEDLGARFAALRARGDLVHQREEARYRLELAADPRAALRLAVANWQSQKEPLDARILLECAVAAGRPDAAVSVARWIRTTGLEGPKLAELLERMARR